MARSRAISRHPRHVAILGMTTISPYDLHNYIGDPTQVTEHPISLAA
jgi:hypothetical protein